MSADEHVAELLAGVMVRGAHEAHQLLETEPDETIACVMGEVNPARALRILDLFPTERRAQILALAPADHGKQLALNESYPEGTIGRLMDPPVAMFPPDQTVGATIEQLREIVRHAFVTYGYVVDLEGRLLGVLVFRELMFAERDQKLSDIMLRDPFSLHPDTPVLDAMRDVVKLHFPAYPVTNAAGRLVGIVRGQTLFEHQAFEISAQAGAMVGVEKEERLSTPWQRSLKFRHPWLQFNLLTAFIAAAVVGFFEHTIEEIVVLAVFLPVLAGQSGNTGCQALAVTLRGMTLGELKPSDAGRLVAKEAWLGFLNGAGVGVSAAIGMLFFTLSKGDPNAWILALVTSLAMVGSCVASGISGALVPMTLRRLGFDPATASSIFLTTATDVASMGLFLSLATWLIL